MNVNFAFIRHGYGCHNAMSTLVHNDIISLNDARQFMKNQRSNKLPNILENDILPLNDPVLTNIGVEASIYNGCIINKILKQMKNIIQDPNLKMETFNVVGCSPLIRCMETAYYMTRKWQNPPDQIYVFPLLREIDESSVDKYSEESREIIRVTPSYSIKSIEEQKEYLRSLGILQYFNFSFVESFPQERLEPGDIKQFMSWFSKYFIPLIENKDIENLNVFVTTHAGVLKDFSGEGFYNNSGFIINTTLNKDIYNFNKYVSLNTYINEYKFFSDYKNVNYNSVEYYCPSNRCGQLCSVAKGPVVTQNIKQIGLQCELDIDTQENIKSKSQNISHNPFKSVPREKRVVTMYRKRTTHDKPPTTSNDQNWQWD